MARSIDPAAKAERGFLPPRNDEERFLMRHVEDLARAAQTRSIPRYSGFLSDREQDLARAALGRAGMQEGWRFDGGYPDAERRVLCIEPEYCDADSPVCCVQLCCRAQAGAALPAHKDYLGSLMGLGLTREKIGDILVSPQWADVLVGSSVADFLLQEWTQAGRVHLRLSEIGPEEIAVPEQPAKLLRDTVASLRLDSVLAAGFSLSRSAAADLIRSGKVEENWMSCEKPDAPVQQGDVLTARGLGKCLVESVGGQSRKGRTGITMKRFL